MNLTTAAVTLFAAATLVACGAPSSPTPAPGGAGPGPTPLADALPRLAPRAVWEHFVALTQIPRPPGHEEQAIAYVVAHARTLGLKAAVDEAGNVLVRAPATRGHERAPGVVLQAHLDMVPQRTPTATVDPAVDGVRAVVEDGWVRAEGTSLGADNGIGVALILAALDDEELAHGPLEALFTTCEEVGLAGATALAADALQNRLLINLDQSREGFLTIGSAGSARLRVDATYAQQTPPAGTVGLLVTMDGLRGGHSGQDIDKGRGSANQLIARLLIGAPAAQGVRLAALSGGDAHNAIARTATATVAVPAAQAHAFQGYVEQFGDAAAADLGAADPDLRVTVTSVGVPAQVMNGAAQHALLTAVAVAPQGVYRMSAQLPGIVETSGNLGRLAIGSGRLSALVMVRSAVNSERDAEARRFAAVFRRAGATVTIERRYSSWEANPNSALLALLKTAYRDASGTSPAATTIHGGLEMSVIGAKYPGMDMIAFGPNALDYHSPSERVEIASVGRVYEVLLTALERIGEQRTRQRGGRGGAGGAPPPQRAGRGRLRRPARALPARRSSRPRQRGSGRCFASAFGRDILRVATGGTPWSPAYRSGATVKAYA
jgi:dipeptidase D